MKNQRIVFLIYKATSKGIYLFTRYYYRLVTKLIFYFNGIEFSTLKSLGLPVVTISLGGKCSIGKNLHLNSGPKHNPIGRNTYTYFTIYHSGVLKIGDNVGISNSAICCFNSVEIGNNVLLGGGVCIYDSDFHPIAPKNRKDLLSIRNDDQEKLLINSLPIKISHNVFIGAHSTILKGVTIGENSIIGACSVVTKNVPANQLWAGNPAKYIKDL